MATYRTQISYAGQWHDDADLTIDIKNRKDVVPAKSTPATGTTVTWSSSNGNGSITFFNDPDWDFNGSAQFPGEGPVGYRGKMKS